MKPIIVAALEVDNELTNREQLDQLVEHIAYLPIEDSSYSFFHFMIEEVEFVAARITREMEVLAPLKVIELQREFAAYPFEASC